MWGSQWQGCVVIINQWEPCINPPEHGCHQAIESKQCMSVSSESIEEQECHAHDIGVDIVTSSWHCHASRDTVWQSHLTWTQATSSTLSRVSRFLIGHWVSILASHWLSVTPDSAEARYLHNFSFISVPWLGPAQYTEEDNNEYSWPEEWSCDVWLLRYPNIKCDNNDPGDITAASLAWTVTMFCDALSWIYLFILAINVNGGVWEWSRWWVWVSLSFWLL